MNEETSVDRGARLRGLRPGVLFALAAFALGAAHFGMILYTFGWPLSPGIYFSQGDYATHAEQVHRVLEAWQTAGRTWAYDVQLLAGVPNGVIFDADNKGWEFWTIALVELGVDPVKAFNSFPLAIHFALPFVVYAASRLFAFGWVESLAAAAMAVALFWFDSFTHWMWYVGTVSYVFVSYFFLIPLALFHRWIEGRRYRDAIGCAIALALGHFVHPYIFFILVGPMLADYVRAGRGEAGMKPAEHAATWSIAAFTLAFNAWWLAIALRFSHYLLDSAYFGRAGLEFIFYEFFGITVDVETQGIIGPRTAMRVAALVAAVFALRGLRSRGDRRRLPFLVTLVVLAALTFLGSYTPAIQIQPFRHALPLGFALVIPAGVGLVEMARARPWRGLTSPQLALGVMFTLLVLQLFARDALYYFGSSLEELEVEREESHRIDPLGHVYSYHYRYVSDRPWERWELREGIIRWVEENDDGRGRWLVQQDSLGEYLAARTDAQVLGGFFYRNLGHSDANWFRRHGLSPPYDVDAMRSYFDDYAVRWVVVHRQNMSRWWDAQRGLLSRAAIVDDQVIFRVELEPRLIDVPGEIRASTNRLEVTGTSGESDVLLRFHWMETLRCRPDCRVERASVEGDRIGFIRVPAPHPPDFVVENTYRWPD